MGSVKDEGVKARFLSCLDFKYSQIHCHNFVGYSLLAPGEKASFDDGTQPDTVDSICHIVWLLINLNAASAKLAVV